MKCIRKCPHLVRHGAASEDGQSIVYRNMCGLSLRKPPEGMKPKIKPGECTPYPYGKGFEYTSCENYQSIFKTKGLGNDALPTQDFQLNEIMTSSASLAEMELF